MQHSVLYLASGSPRRHEILKQLAISHCVLEVPTPEGDDEPQLPGEAPEHYVRRTAMEKLVRASKWLRDVNPEELAHFINKRYPDIEALASAECSNSHFVLTADTTVILHGQALGKPADLADAAKTLRMLSGQAHRVHTAVALQHNGKISETVSVSEVQFKPLSESEIEAYCATGDPLGKAGAYGIQGPAAAFVKHLSGSYTGVMGLPAYETTTLLGAAGYRWQSQQK